MGRRLGALVIAAVAMLWGAPVWAHTARQATELPAPIATPATTAFDVPLDAWSVAAFAIMVLLIAASRQRKALGAALVVLTLWMGFEAGTHSVHHFGQPSEQGRCAVASIMAHASAIPSDANVCAGILLARTRVAGDVEPAAQGHALAATHEGRAPPRLSL